jgi:transcriptional regulator with XRE-family HTH domain
LCSTTYLKGEIVDIIITPELAKKARKELEMSQSAAASGIGMNRSYLSLYENGKIILSGSELDSIKEYNVKLKAMYLTSRSMKSWNQVMRVLLLALTLQYTIHYHQCVQLMVFR